ncbi:MAG: polymer-forming cytoskeletal protein, partial [Huintestinicola sp.]
MSLKDNFNQAVKEILKKDGLVGDNLSKGSRKKTEVDKFMGETAVPGGAGESLAPGAQTPAESYGTDYSETSQPSADEFRQAVHNQPSADPFGEDNRATDSAPIPETPLESYSRFEYQTAADSFTPPPTPPPVNRASYGGGGYNPPRTPSGGSAFRGGRPPETPYYETEETTVISRNTRISGDISSFANINVEGSVQGNIKLTKNIAVSGKVVGNIECNNAVMAGAQMQGSISSKGQVQIDHDSILLGDIDTQYLDLNGRIQGNVEVGGKAEFKNDAIIVGDITASTISVIDGAIIRGYVNTTFMQDSTSNVFPEAITVG